MSATSDTDCACARAQAHGYDLVRVAQHLVPALLDEGLGPVHVAAERQPDGTLELVLHEPEQPDLDAEPQRWQRERARRLDHEADA